jgi:hypothetical protein
MSASVLRNICEKLRKDILRGAETRPHKVLERKSCCTFFVELAESKCVWASWSLGVGPSPYTDNAHSASTAAGQERSQSCPLERETVSESTTG